MIMSGLRSVGRSVRDPRGFLVVSLIVVLLVVSSGLMLGSRRGEAGPWPVNVRGYVEDLAHNKIQGANVTVEMVNTGSVVTATLWYDSTLSSGLYTVSFQSGDWDPGYTIRVTARYGSDTGQNSAVATSDGMQWVNVTVSTVIPEFSGLLGLSMPLVTIGMMAIFVVGCRGRRREPPAPQ
jgi:hypothetical protein